MNTFDPKYNSPSGKQDPEPYSKAENISKVAKAIGHERDQTGSGMKFRIGENQAKKINHDAPPK